LANVDDDAGTDADTAGGAGCVALVAVVAAVGDGKASAVFVDLAAVVGIAIDVDDLFVPAEANADSFDNCEVTSTEELQVAAGWAEMAANGLFLSELRTRLENFENSIDNVIKLF
jgi:hypothetical protein